MPKQSRAPFFRVSKRRRHDHSAVMCLVSPKFDFLPAYCKDLDTSADHLPQKITAYRR